jgi:hypothetical protein
MDGLQEINQMMIDMRENPLKEINGQRVIMLEDYQSIKTCWTEANLRWLFQNRMC